MPEENEIVMVPEAQIPPNAARLNVTWQGNNGDLPDPVPYDATDEDLKTMAAEAIQNGDIPGIPADANIALGDFVTDRFAATGDVPYARVFIRPKTPFGMVPDLWQCGAVWERTEPLQ